MIKGAFLYFGAGPLNWLNSHDCARIQTDLEHIRSDGFDSVFLLIPWAEVLYDESGYTTEVLEKILSAAAALDLTIYLRIFYLWETNELPRATYQLLNEWPVNNNLSDEFLVYFDRLKAIETKISAKFRYIISWEDLYWPIYRHWPAVSIDERTALAEASGYTDFCRLIGASDRARNAIPTAPSDSQIIFSAFFDHILCPRFIAEAKKHISEVYFEYRVDSDLVGHHTTPPVAPIYYHWGRSHPFVDYSVIYFHQNLGGPKQKDISGMSAVANLDWLLRTMAPMRNHSERLPLIDQFNFIDTTEPDWAKLTDSNNALSDFMGACSYLLPEASAGVVLWGYYDWARDVIYNGRFNQSFLGWNTSPSISNTVNCNGCHLTSGDVIAQKLHCQLPVDTDWTLALKISSVIFPAVIQISHCSFSEEIAIADAGEYYIKIPPKNRETLTLTALSGELTLEQVQLYDRIYSQGGKRLDGSVTAPFSKFSEHILSENHSCEAAEMEPHTVTETPTSATKQGSNMSVSYPDLMATAAQLRASGNNADAATLFKQAMQLAPSDPHPILAFYQCLIDEGNPIDIEEARSHVAHFNPAFADFLHVYYHVKAQQDTGRPVVEAFTKSLDGFHTGSESDWFLFDLFNNEIASPRMVFHPHETLNLTPEEKIPRNLFLYFDKNPPQEILDNVDNFRSLLSHSVKLYNRDEAIDFIKQYYGYEHAKIFTSLGHPSAESDFFRWHIIHTFGGYYIDVDFAPISPHFQVFLASQSCRSIFFRSAYNRSPLISGFFGACSGERVIERAINLVIYNSLLHPNLSMWLRTGPGVITRAVVYEYILETVPGDLKPTISDKLALNNIVRQVNVSYRNDERDWRYFEANKNR